MSFVSGYRHFDRSPATSRGLGDVWASVLRWAGVLALPALLWITGSLFFGGQIGLNSDDYALNLRDPVTGRLMPGVSTLVPYNYFFRPLHLALTFSAGTYLPDAHRALHIISAISHALVAAGVFWLASLAGRRMLGAVCGAMIFLTLPINAEVILWFSTISTSISVLAFLWLTFLVIRFAECEDDRLAVRGPLLIAAVAFIVACLFEQPLAGTAGLPILCLATRAGPRSVRARAGRGVQVAFACAAAGLAYSTLLLWTAPAGARGGAGSFVPVARLGGRFTDVASQIASSAFGDRARDMLVGSLLNAWGVLATPIGVVLGALALAAAASLVWNLAGRASMPDPDAKQDLPRLRPGWTLLAVALSLFAAWLPVYIIDHQIVQDRTFYFPAAMACVGLAIIIDQLLHLIRITSAGTVLGAATVLLASGVSVVGAVSQVGSQRAFRDRAHADNSILQQLAYLLPNPPHNALLVPMRLDDLAASTGVRTFDSSLVGVMHTHWSATDSLRRLYRRSDIGAMGSVRWLCPPFVSVTPTTTGISPEHTRGWTRLPIRESYPWSSIVPFAVDAQGKVRLAKALIVEQPDGTDVRIPIAASADAPPLVLRTWDDRPPHQGERITTWAWDVGNTPVEFPHTEVWSGRRACTWLHPVGAGGSRRQIQTTIAGSTQARRLVVRATISENDLARSKELGSVVVVIERRGEHAEELARVEIAPEVVSRRRGWIPIVANIPPSAGEIALTLRVEPGQRTTGTPEEHRSVVPPVTVTPGLLLPAPTLPKPER